MWMGHGGRFLKGNTYRPEAQGFAEVGLYMCARSCTCGFAHPHVNHVHQGMLHLVLWIWLNACVSVYEHMCEKACIYVLIGVCCVYTGDYSCVCMFQGMPVYMHSHVVLWVTVCLGYCDCVRVHWVLVADALSECLGAA